MYVDIVHTLKQSDSNKYNVLLNRIIKLIIIYINHIKNLELVGSIECGAIFLKHHLCNNSSSIKIIFMIMDVVSKSIICRSKVFDSSIDSLVTTSNLTLCYFFTLT